VAVDGDEVAEEIVFPAASFDLGDGAAELEQVAEDEVHGHEAVQIKFHAGAEQGGEAEGEAGLVQAAVGPDSAGERETEEAEARRGLHLCNRVEDARIIECAAGEDLPIRAGERETGAAAGMVNFILPRAEAQQLGEFPVDPGTLGDLLLQPRPVVEAEGAQALLPGPDHAGRRALGAGQEITE
jgi:hypothetical protein